MAYKPISIDRQNLSIMGVPFPDLETLNSTADAIGSNMFEGFEPTKKLIELYRDYRAGKLASSRLLALIKDAI
jgi:putative transcriptional regulator